MPAPNANTFSVASPYRPALGDFNNAALSNSPIKPPDPTTMPTAELFNTLGLLAIAYGSVIPSLLVSVKQTAGVYTVDLFAAPNANILVGGITLVKNGVGDVTVYVVNTALPQTLVRPMAILNEDIDGFVRCIDYNTGGNRGARVKIKTVTNAPAFVEGGFTVVVF